jgi:hypothetical protein
MKLNKKLNLVFEVERVDGATVYVHHTPILKEIFEKHYELITIAMADLYGKGLRPVAASRIAYYKLRELIDNPVDKRYAQAEMTLLAEIWRSTYVLAPGKAGYDTIPLQEAFSNGIIDDEDIAEVQNLVCFFTLASWVHGRQERKGIYEIMTDSGSEITSLSCTEWKPSSKTLKTDENTGAKATP